MADELLARSLLLREDLHVTIDHELLVVYCPTADLEEVAAEVEHSDLGLSLALDQLRDLNVALVGHLDGHEPFALKDELLALEGGVQLLLCECVLRK